MSTSRESSAGTESAPAPKPAAPVLVRMDVPEAQTIRLNRALTIVGTKAHAHLRIISTEISGTHALLLNLGNNVFLRDLMSRTHTYVNDQKVSECRLKYGDVVRFGQMQFRFVDLDVLRQSLASARSAPAELHRDGQVTPLNDRSPMFVIGKERGADLRLTSGPLSKVHAVLYEHAGKHVLRDLSRHGTFVDGQRIRTLELQGNEVIDIGGTQFRYQSRQGASPASAVEAAAPESKVAPAASIPAPPQAVAELAEDEADAAGGQYVFAPEPEILSDHPSPEVIDDDGAPTDTFESADDLSDPIESPPEEGTWELAAQEPANSPMIKLQSERVDSGTEQAESAGDLLNWGFTVERDITTASMPPEAVTTVPDSSAGSADVARPMAKTDPVTQPAAEVEPFPPLQHADVAPFDDAESPSKPRPSPRKSRGGESAPAGKEDSFLSGAVDLEPLTHGKSTAGEPPVASSPQETRPEEAAGGETEFAPTAKRAKSKSQPPSDVKAVAPQPSGEPRRKARKLQSLDGILGEEILTLGPSAEQTPAEEPLATRRSSRRVLFIATAIILLIALSAAAWWYLHSRV
jgi:pSer/pThr/pTyr-binding forkhead associated (FHA) protein